MSCVSHTFTFSYLEDAFIQSNLQQLYSCQEWSPWSNLGLSAMLSGTMVIEHWLLFAGIKPATFQLPLLAINHYTTHSFAHLVAVILPRRTCSWINMFCWSWSNVCLNIVLTLTHPESSTTLERWMIDLDVDPIIYSAYIYIYAFNKCFYPK